MVGITENGKDSTPPLIEAVQLEDDPHKSPRNSQGWDGKLRVDRRPVVLSNPEAISDPEYSDDENVLEGEQISADEGMALMKT
jgi:protein phosphatase 1 regulatory subunit 7